VDEVVRKGIVAAIEPDGCGAPFAESDVEALNGDMIGHDREACRCARGPYEHTFTCAMICRLSLVTSTLSL